LAEHSHQCVRTSLAAFIDEAGSRLYRHLVEYHVKRQSTAKLQQAVLGETSGLPSDLASLVIGYIDAVNLRFARDEAFWKTATCRKASEEFLGIAANMFSFAEPSVSSRPSLRQENDQMDFALFQIATLSFAYSASTQRAQRKFMGIRKGIFG